MKDIKHICRDIHSVPWVMPQGSNLGVPWGVERSKKFFSEIQPDLVCELLTSMAHATEQFFWSPSPGEGPKGFLLSISLNKMMSAVKFGKSLSCQNIIAVLNVIIEKSIDGISLVCSIFGITSCK